MSFTRINTNPEALLATASLRKLNSQMSRTLAHLSTGKRIVTGADDPLGVAMLGTFKAQLGGTSTALRNAEEGLSMMQTADSFLTGVVDVLVHMRDLAVRCSTEATLTTAQRDVLNDEFSALMTHVDNVVKNAKFNTKKLFSGEMNGQTLQIGAYNGIEMSVQLSTYQLSDMGLALTLSIKSAGAAQNAISTMGDAISVVAGAQGTLGAQARAIESIVNDLSMQVVNIASAASNVEDADLALEISAFARQQILAASATAMVAQANAQPQQVVQLLGMG